MQIGDIYWLQIKSDIKHPHVVVNISNSTADVCAITTNAKKISMPKTVVLNAGSANLKNQSIVEAYKIYTVKINDLVEYIGTLDSTEIKKIRSVL